MSQLNDANEKEVKTISSKNSTDGYINNHDYNLYGQERSYENL